MKKKRRLKKGPIVFLIFILLGILLLILKPFGKTQKENKQNSNPINNNNSVTSPTNKSKKMSIFMVGDVLIHETVYQDASLGNGNYDFSDMFSYIKPMLKKYDLRYFNQESTIGGKNLGISAYPSFNSPDEIGDNLVDIGFNMVSLANNHSLDRGQSAVQYSNNYWKNKGIITAGTYSSLTERDNVHVYEQNGIKYAFLSYTTSSNAQTPNNYILNMYSDERAKNDINKAKENGAEVIIVAMHWGTEYTNKETASQRRIAEYLSSLDVNLIIGTHPHVVEPIEYVGDTLVFYSLGNFISNQLVLGVNEGTGMISSVDIVISEDGKVEFENLNYELILSYSDNSTNFKVIPYSKLNDNLLKNYETYKQEFEGYVEEYMEI